MLDLKEWLQDAKKVAVLGVGSRIKRDDAVGVAVVDQLKGKVSRSVRLFDCETVPESFTGPIRQFAPSHVLIIDAAILGLNPGETRIFTPDSIVESASSTHTLSLSIVSQYLASEVGAKVLVLGIQPKDLQLGTKMTRELTRAAKRISQVILSALSEVEE